MRRRRAVAATAAEGKKERVELPFRRVWPFIIIAAVALYVFELFATYAAHLPSAFYYPVSRAIAIMGSFLLDVIVFKNRITPKSSWGSSCSSPPLCSSTFSLAKIHRIKRTHHKGILPNDVSNFFVIKNFA